MVQRRAAVDDAVTTRPGVIASALAGHSAAGVCAFGEFPEGQRWGIQRGRIDLLRARATASRAISISSSSAKISSESGRNIPGPQGIFLKRGKDVDIRRLELVSVRPMAEARGSRARHAPLHLEVVHLSAGGGAVRVPVRHERVSGVSRAASRVRSAGHLSVHPWRRRGPTGSRLPLCARVSRDVGRSRVLRLARARAVQFLARALRRLLLGVQGGRARPGALAAGRPCVRLHRGRAHWRWQRFRSRRTCSSSGRCCCWPRAGVSGSTRSPASSSALP